MILIFAFVAFALISILALAWSMRKRSFFPGLGDAFFKEDFIVIKRYPFPGTQGKIRPQDLYFVDLTAQPPMICIKGDLMFISAEHLEKLKNFVYKKGVPVRQGGISNWECLLSPFLDTELSEKEQNRLDEILKKRGFTGEEIASWRQRLAPVMRAYNIDSGLWDWTSLGFSDVLSAMHATLSRKEFTAFYKEALAIELKGRPALQ
jgi:hypothetical protein